MSDIGGFCGRNPQACETGGDALTAIGSRARDGARIVYEFLDTQIAEKSGSEQLVTGSTPVQSAGTTSGQPSGQEPQVFAGTPSWQPVFDNVSSKEAVLGPVPRPKPRSGQRPEHTGRSRSYDLLDLKTADCAPLERCCTAATQRRLHFSGLFRCAADGKLPISSAAYLYSPSLAPAGICTLPLTSYMKADKTFKDRCHDHNLERNP